MRPMRSERKGRSMGEEQTDRINRGSKRFCDQQELQVEETDTEGILLPVTPSTSLRIHSTALHNKLPKVTKEDGDNWEPSMDEFLIEDIGYPIQGNATRGKFDKLPIITQDGIPLKKTEVPKLKQYVAGNNRALVRNGWLKFKIEGYKQPSGQFMKTYNGLKMGKNLYGAPVTAKVLELYKLMDGIHYTRYHDVQSSLKKLPCLSKVSFAEINEKLANSFGGSDPLAVTRSFWNLIEKLPIDKNRNGRGLLIPYPVIEGDANLDDDVVRSNLDLNNLDSPLLQLENQSDRSVPEQRGVTRPIILCGFPASFSATRIQDGPAPASVDIILLGGVKCCLVVPARYFNKARKCLIRDLLSLNLAKTDHLLTNDFRCIMQHRNLLLGPDFFNRHGIPYSVVHQKAGEIMVIGSKASHCDVTCAASVRKTCCAVFSDFNFSYVDDFKQCECPRDVVEDKVDWNKRTSNEPTHSEPSGPGRVTNTGRYFAQPKDIEMLLGGSETLLDEMHSKKSERVKKDKGKYTYREDKKWICSNCFKHFTKERGLNEHRKKSCNKYGVCRREGCNKTSDRKERFEKHERWHQEEDKKQGFVTPMKTVHQPSLSHTSRKTKKRSSLSISNNDESEKDSSTFQGSPPATPTPANPLHDDEEDSRSSLGFRGTPPATPTPANPLLGDEEDSGSIADFQGSHPATPTPANTLHGDEDDSRSSLGFQGTPPVTLVSYSDSSDTPSEDSEDAISPAISDLPVRSIANQFHVTRSGGFRQRITNACLQKWRRNVRKDYNKNSKTVMSVPRLSPPSDSSATTLKSQGNPSNTDENLSEIEVPRTEETVTPSEIEVPGTEETVTPSEIEVLGTEETVTISEIEVPRTEETVTPLEIEVPGTNEPDIGNTIKRTRGSTMQIPTEAEFAEHRQNLISMMIDETTQDQLEYAILVTTTLDDSIEHTI